MIGLTMRFLCGFILCAALASCAQQPAEQSPANERPAQNPAVYAEKEPGPELPLLDCVYFDREQFLSAVASPPLYRADDRVSAGMIPHHLLASDMIAGFFALAARHDYDRVIVLGPSHFPLECGSEVVTAAAGWDTPYGPLSGDAETAGAILRNSIVAAEDNPLALERDHGVSGLMPFIKYYMPDVKVTAILLANTLDFGRLEEIRRLLGPVCEDAGTLLVLSVDCSHYLMPHEAARRDKQTRQAIEAFDFEAIARFDDGNADSPQAITLMLWLAQKQGAELKQLDHSSSAYKLPQGISHPIYYDGITTYFVYAVLNK